ncbi:MAG: serine acetyltransferase [Alphaproteobacteria bacterium GM202ARS2]|nr:serine acetyltransferase [Alphaproteobacteria bacterium GM202ARS2]
MFFKRLNQDLTAFCSRDPAATSKLHVLLLYPGLHALLLHRLAHRLWRMHLRFPALFIAFLSRFLTNIEIHPAATIQEGLVIDHGSGLVIGETTIIGKHCTLYQNVTLGGIAPSINTASQKNRQRHPHLHDYVIIGAGAQVLGAITIGTGARIGANAVVTNNVKPHTTVVGIPAKPIKHTPQKTAPDFQPYALTTDTQKDDKKAR